MSTLAALLHEQAALSRRIVALQTEARDKAIEDVRSLMAQHGLSAADLKGAPSGNRRGAVSSEATGRAKVAAKYRDPHSGATWSGRGLKPRWLTAAMADGKTLSEFAV